MSKKGVSGDTEELRGKLKSPTKVETKSVGKRVRRALKPLHKLTEKDEMEYKMRAYAGVRNPQRDIGVTKRDKVPENAHEFVKKLAPFFPKAVFTTADLYNGGTVHRVFQPGSDLMLRFVIDPQFPHGVGVGNPMWMGNKRSGGKALMEYVEDIVPQRNKLDNYRYFALTDKNFRAVCRFMTDAGFTPKQT